MDELIMTSEEGKIIFSVLQNDWCELYFDNGSDIIKLGANDIMTIFSKLIISFLPEKNRKYFSYSGLNMFSIVNLMDSHAVLAGGFLDSELLHLYFISTEGVITPIMKLTEEMKKDWVVKIIFFIINRKKGK